MADTRQTAFEAFLVEDVILTLANLRASLAWFSETAAAQNGAPDDALRRRAGLERIDRQIGMLEDRARAVCDGLRPESEGTGVSEAAAAITAPAGPESDGMAAWRRDGAEDRGGDRGGPEATAVAAPLSIAGAIRDALGADAPNDAADDAGPGSWPGAAGPAAVVATADTAPEDVRGPAAITGAAIAAAEVAAAEVAAGAVTDADAVAAPIFRSRRAG